MTLISINSDCPGGREAARVRSLVQEPGARAAAAGVRLLGAVRGEAGGREAVDAGHADGAAPPPPTNVH